MPTLLLIDTAVVAIVHDMRLVEESDRNGVDTHRASYNIYVSDGVVCGITQGICKTCEQVPQLLNVLVTNASGILP